MGQAPRRHGRRHRAPRSPAASRACAEVRATELANEGPHGLAVWRQRAIELNRPRSRSPEMAGFEVSTNGRFCPVHRGASQTRRFAAIAVAFGLGGRPPVPHVPASSRQHVLSSNATGGNGLHDSPRRSLPPMPCKFRPCSDVLVAVQVDPENLPCSSDFVARDIAGHVLTEGDQVCLRSVGTGEIARRKIGPARVNAVGAPRREPVAVRLRFCERAVVLA